MGTVKTGYCQNWTLSEPGFVGTGHCRNYMGTVGTGPCRNYMDTVGTTWVLFELYGHCQNGHCRKWAL